MSASYIATDDVGDLLTVVEGEEGEYALIVGGYDKARGVATFVGLEREQARELMDFLDRVI